MKNKDKSAQEIHGENLQKFLKRIDKVKNFGMTWEQLANQAMKQKESGKFSHQDCWIWLGSAFTRQRSIRTTDRKLPSFVIVDPVTKLRKQVYARRFAWFLLYGFPLRDGHDGQWFGLFRCQNDWCVNPTHGTVTSAMGWKQDEYIVANEVMQDRQASDPLAVEAELNRRKKSPGTI